MSIDIQSSQGKYTGFHLRPGSPGGDFAQAPIRLGERVVRPHLESVYRERSRQPGEVKSRFVESPPNGGWRGAVVEKFQEAQYQ